MPTKKPTPGKSSRGSDAQSSKASGAVTSARSTVSAPAQSEKGASAADAATQKMAGANELAASMPFNANKSGNMAKHLRAPRPVRPPTWGSRVTGSSLTESILSPKVGAGKPNLGFNPGSLPLDRVRVDSSDQPLTTNQGVPVADNQIRSRLGSAGPPCWRISSSREDHALRSRTDPRAHRARPRLRSARLFRVLRAHDQGHARFPVFGGRQADPGGCSASEGPRTRHATCAASR